MHQTQYTLRPQGGEPEPCGEKLLDVSEQQCTELSAPACQCGIQNIKLKKIYLSNIKTYFI